MLLREYIELLQAIEREFGGDLEVQRWNISKGRHHAPPPEIAYEKLLVIESPRRARCVPLGHFWQAGYDSPEVKGDRVVRI